MWRSDADISGNGQGVWQERIPSSQPESHGLQLLHSYGEVMRWRGAWQPHGSGSSGGREAGVTAL